MKNLIVWILVFCAIMIIAYVLFAPQAGASREDISRIQKDIRDTQSRIGSLDISISVQKAAYSDAQDQVKKAQDNLRKAKKLEGKSWDFLPSIKSANDALSSAMNSTASAKAGYFSLLQQKSDEIKNLKSLKEFLKIAETEDKGNATAISRKMILIQISSKCEDMISHHFNTTCPSYSQLRKFDSSNVKISGEFGIFNDTYKRGPPAYKESWRGYDHDEKHRIIVDPPLGMAERYPLITIESNLDTFLQPDSKSMQQNYIILNQTKHTDAWGRNGTYQGLKSTVPLPVVDLKGSRIIYHDVFVDKKCKNAIINADKWNTLLPLMIDYFGNSCTGSLNNTEIVIKNYTVQHIETTQKYKHDKWIESVTIELKIGNDNSTNPSVTEDRMPKYVPKIHPPFDYPK